MSDGVANAESEGNAGWSGAFGVVLGASALWILALIVVPVMTLFWPSGAMAPIVWIWLALRHRRYGRRRGGAFYRWTIIPFHVLGVPAALFISSLSMVALIATMPTYETGADQSWRVEYLSEKLDIGLAPLGEPAHSYEFRIADDFGVGVIFHTDAAGVQAWLDSLPTEQRSRFSLVSDPEDGPAGSDGLGCPTPPEGAEAVVFEALDLLCAPGLRDAAARIFEIEDVENEISAFVYASQKRGIVWAFRNDW